jgi:hypothetical protein
MVAVDLDELASFAHVAGTSKIVKHARTYLYVAHSVANLVAVYSLTDPLNPAEVQHFAIDSICSLSSLLSGAQLALPYRTAA